MQLVWVNTELGTQIEVMDTLGRRVKERMPFQLILPCKYPTRPVIPVPHVRDQFRRLAVSERGHLIVRLKAHNPWFGLAA